MSPFCTVKWETRDGNPQEDKTETLEGAGKEPHWNAVFNFEIDAGDDDTKLAFSDYIHFKVLDQDMLTTDHVGFCALKVS